MSELLFVEVEYASFCWQSAPCVKSEVSFVSKASSFVLKMSSFVLLPGKGKYDVEWCCTVCVGEGATCLSAPCAM